MELNKYYLFNQKNGKCTSIDCRGSSKISFRMECSGILDYEGRKRYAIKYNVIL